MYIKGKLLLLPGLCTSKSIGCLDPVLLHPPEMDTLLRVVFLSCFFFLFILSFFTVTLHHESFCYTPNWRHLLCHGDKKKDRIANKISTAPIAVN